MQPPYGKVTLLSGFILSVLTTTTLFGGKLDYDYALKWARQGDMEKSLQTLDMLYKENPQNKHLLYDYITVLGWANQDKEALSLAKSIDFDTAPRYALQNIAKSARNAKQFKYATKLYVKGAKRFPQQPDFYLGLGLTLNDMKRSKLSKKVFQKAQDKFPDNLDIKFAQAAGYEQYKNYFDAMAIYQNLLKYPKVYDKAVVKLVGTLRRQGMAFAAQKYVVLVVYYKFYIMDPVNHQILVVWSSFLTIYHTNSYKIKIDIYKVF
jgi:tetratricopeptide (TPR) repeat protein